MGEDGLGRGPCSGQYIQSAHMPGFFLLESTKVQKWNLLRPWRREKCLASKELRGKGYVVWGREVRPSGRRRYRMKKESDRYGEQGC